MIVTATVIEIKMLNYLFSSLTLDLLISFIIVGSLSFRVLCQDLDWDLSLIEKVKFVILLFS